MLYAKHGPECGALARKVNRLNFYNLRHYREPGRIAGALAAEQRMSEEGQLHAC